MTTQSVKFCEIRCQEKYYNKTFNSERTCNKLGGKIAPGGKGELFCSRHGAFLFEVDPNWQPKKIKVQKSV